MDSKKPILMAMLIVLLCSATAVYGKFVYSFNYVECNKVEGAKTTKDLDKTYAQWTTKITNQLTYNATGQKTLKVLIEKADSTDSLTLTMVSTDYYLALWYKSGSDNFEIASISNGWEKGKPVILTLSGSYLQLQLSNGTYLVKDYAIGSYSTDQVSVFAGSVYDFTAGYVTADVDANLTGGITTSIMDVVVPIAVLAVSLGVITKVLNKLSKKA